LLNIFDKVLIKKSPKAVFALLYIQKERCKLPSTFRSCCNYRIKVTAWIGDRTKKRKQGGSMGKAKGATSDQGVELGVKFKKGVKGKLCPFCQGERTMEALFLKNDVRMKVDCPICEGRGFQDHPAACPKCHGTGTVTEIVMNGLEDVSCSSCLGTGRFI